MKLVTILLVAAFVTAAAIAARRAGEVFRLTMRKGAVKVRGVAPLGLRSDLEDVLRRAGVRDATLRGVRRDGRVRLETRGVSPDVAQRLRNALAVHRL